MTALSAVKQILNSSNISHSTNRVTTESDEPLASNQNRPSNAKPFESTPILSSLPTSPKKLGKPRPAPLKLSNPQFHVQGSSSKLVRLLGSESGSKKLDHVKSTNFHPKSKRTRSESENGPIIGSRQKEHESNADLPASFEWVYKQPPKSTRRPPLLKRPSSSDDLLLNRRTQASKISSVSHPNAHTFPNPPRGNKLTMPPPRHSSRQRSSSARANLSTIPLAKALASPFMANGRHVSSQDGTSPSPVTLPSPLPSPSPLSFTPVLFPIGERSTQSLGPEGIEFRVEDGMEEDCEFEVVKEKRLAEDGKQYTSFVLKLRERKANCPPALGLAARRNPTVNVVPVHVPPSPPRDSPLSSPPRTPENSAYWKSPKDNRPYETPPSLPMTPRMRRGLASSYYPQRVSSSTGSKRDSYLALAETYRQRMSREGSEEEGDEAILFSSPQKSPRHGICVGSYAAGAQDTEEEKSAGEKAIENVLNFQTPESDSVNSVAFGNLVVPNTEERAVSWDGYTKVLGTSFGIESESETNQGSIAASSALARDSYRKSSVASSEVTAVNSSNGTEDQRDSPSTTIFARRMGKPNLVLPDLGLNAQLNDMYNLQSHWSETDDGDTEDEEGFSVEEKEQANSGEPIHIISVVS